MAKLQPLALVYNPVAGSRLRLRPRRSIDEVVAALRASGGQPELFETRGPRDGFVHGQEAARCFPLVAVAGGDGSINEVINGMVAAGTGARLLVLPAGSVNVLARDLQIPLDACRAARLLAEGVERRFFLGRAGTRYFALMAGAGLDASIVHSLGRSRFKRTLGPAAFILEGIRHSVAYRFPRLTLRTESGEWSGYFAVVGNSPGYGGWFSLTPAADPGQPSFQVALITTRNPLRYYYLLALALAGALGRSRHVTHLNAVRLRIWSDHPAYVQVDGEPHEMLPMEFASDGTSLQVLVPAGKP